MAKKKGAKKGTTDSAAEAAISGGEAATDAAPFDVPPEVSNAFAGQDRDSM